MIDEPPTPEPERTKAPHFVGGWLLALVVVLAMAVAVFRFSQLPSRRLADGTTLTLLRTTVGHTFTDAHGTLLERFVAPLVPRRVLEGWHLPLDRPQYVSWTNPLPNRTVLTVKLGLSGEAPLLSRSEFLLPPYYSRLRFVTIGEDGFEYVWIPLPFMHYRDGWYSYLMTENFPRDARQLRFRLDRCARPGGPWTAVAAFSSAPRASGAEQGTGSGDWTPRAGPLTVGADGTQFTLG